MDCLLLKDERSLCLFYGVKHQDFTNPWRFCAKNQAFFSTTKKSLFIAQGL